MMKTKTIFLIFTLVAIFTSCQNPYEKEIDLLKERLGAIEQAEKQFKLIDLELVQECADTVSRVIEKIKKEYGGDTINKDQIKLMYQYKALKKSLSVELKDHVRLEKELLYTKNQLRNLITDLENVAIEKKEEAQKFIKVEEMASNALVETINGYLSRIDKLLKDYSHLTPEVSTL